MQENEKIVEDVANRIKICSWTKWRETTGVSCDKILLSKVKLTFYITVMRSITRVVGSECWALEEIQM